VPAVDSGILGNTLVAKQFEYVDRRRQWLENYLKWEDDNLALLGPLKASLAIGLKARKGRKRNLLLARVLPIPAKRA
jgi:hypothetical protein